MPAKVRIPALERESELKPFAPGKLSSTSVLGDEMKVRTEDHEVSSVPEIWSEVSSRRHNRVDVLRRYLSFETQRQVFRVLSR